MFKTRRLLSKPCQTDSYIYRVVPLVYRACVTVRLGHLRNPYLDIHTAPTFMSCYLSQQTRSAMKRVLGTLHMPDGVIPLGAADRS